MNETSTPEFQRDIDAFRDDCTTIVEQVRSVIVGHHQVIDEVLACMLCGGHVLLEGVPGLGKTLLVRTLADTLDITFSRIQFTPDLMPADITGTNILATDGAGGKKFAFEPGPIFANLILADEINRATPKTQSAVLEAMQEQTVSIARTTHKLPLPFFVLATQNPIEMEGTYPLPEAQLDRFMFKVAVASPSVEELTTILDRTTGDETPQPAHAANAKRMQQMQAVVRQVPVASHVTDYISRLVLATHPTSEHAPEISRKYIRYGSSPRGAQAIILAAKVTALRDGRANVAFDDIRAAAMPALRHRLILNFEGQADGVDTDAIITEVLNHVPQATGV